MIRTIDISELPEFTPLAEEFYASTELPGVFRPDIFQATMAKLIGGGQGFMLGRFSDNKPAEAVGCALWPDPFTGELSCGTIFWFVHHPNNGLAAGALATALDRHFVTIGVKHAFIGANAKREKLGGFLLQTGYRLAEMQYRKDF